MGTMTGNLPGAVWASIPTVSGVGRTPQVSFLVWLWCGVHIEVGRYLGSTRNGVKDLGCDLELVCNEAVLFRRREPDTQTGKS